MKCYKKNLIDSVSRNRIKIKQFIHAAARKNVNKKLNSD